jgi:hypothetical protein
MVFCGQSVVKRMVKDGFRNAVFQAGENFANFSSLFSRGGIYTFVTIQLDQKALD